MSVFGYCVVFSSSRSSFQGYFLRLSDKTKKLPKTSVFRELSGGQRGIRTLDTLLTYTRVPVVRLRPAQPSVHIYRRLTKKSPMVRVMGLEPIRLSTHAPQTCLSAYSSTLAKYFNIIHLIKGFVKGFLIFFYFNIISLQIFLS